MLNIVKSIAKQAFYSIYPNAIILLYHRVDDVKDDPHSLCVNPDIFYKHIVYLKENFKIISLSQIVADIKRNKVKKNSVAITFDDGYKDNLYNALPILKKYSIPATIYVTVSNVINQNKFYWDNNTQPKDRGRPLKKEELIELAKEKNIEIGSHSINHPRLSKLSINRQKEEIIRSKDILEKIIGRPIKSFSYPFGTKYDYNKDSISLVKKASYEYACANNPFRVIKYSDIYGLPRIIVRDWKINELKKNLRRC